MKYENLEFVDEKNSRRFSVIGSRDDQRDAPSALYCQIYLIERVPPDEFRMHDYVTEDSTGCKPRKGPEQNGGVLLPSQKSRTADLQFESAPREIEALPYHSAHHELRVHICSSLLAPAIPGR